MDVAYELKLDEIERILNDPAVPLEAARAWFLVAEIARYERQTANAISSPARTATEQI